MAQVLSNLLNNAAKYTDDGGEIALSAEQQGREVVIRVRDNGTGIAPELLPQVFDLFTQADQTLSRSRGGLGIGLTLVRSLVELHDGRVSAHSEARPGSEFVVRLPVAPDAADVPAAPNGEESAAAPSPAPPPHPGRRRQPQQRHEPGRPPPGPRAGSHMAYDGPAALELVRRHRPDVILLDIGLPGMDGYEVARRCRQDAALRPIMLVAMTGYGKKGPPPLAEAGFDAHLVKPVNLEDLQVLLNQPNPRAAGRRHIH